MTAGSPGIEQAHGIEDNAAEHRRQLAEILRGQIASGELKKDARITESELTETYEVARNTARRGLAVLREDGLIMTVPQRGSYVM
jgi:DNA-binding GntR family transcriptional regulator